MNDLKSSKTFWQTTFIFTFAVSLVILAWSILRWIDLKVVLWRSVWVIPLVLYLAVLIGCIFLFLRLRKDGEDGLIAFLELGRFSETGWRMLAGAFFVVILLAIPYLK